MAVNLFGRAAAINGDAGDDEDIDDDPSSPLPIPVHAFDVMVADECHRGYNAQVDAIFRRTLDRFDAVRVGLTATPAPHTKAYFEHTAYTYKYEDAVREGYLVDYDVIAVASGVAAKGVFLQEGEQVRVVDLATGKDSFENLEEQRAFDAEALEREITVPDTTRKVLGELKTFTDAFENDHGRFPKTLVFACNDQPHKSHAQALVAAARTLWGRGDEFVEKITGKVDRPLRRVKEFRNRKDRPGIAVTVDLLSTGVDVPDLEVIVFLRFVRSRILFAQMLGRGTRRSDDLSDKSRFTVVDCFNGTLVRYFHATTDMTEAPPEKPSKPIGKVIDDIWDNRDRAYQIRCLVKRLQRIDKEMSGEARDQFAQWLPDGDVAAFAKALPGKLANDFAATMKLLRDAKFKALLADFPRPRRVFTVAEHQVDAVSSEWLVRGLDGKEYKPADYLTVFDQYVRDNPDQIHAIQILLNHPKDWSVGALQELRTRLCVAGPGFDELQLRKAHQIRYDKALVDIISMVKHAARAEEALLSAEERIDRAFDAVTAGKTFTREQQAWLGRIRGHLLRNLSIDTGDFEIMPAFADFGGYEAANEVFGGALDALIERINGAVAA